MSDLRTFRIEDVQAITDNANAAIWRSVDDLKVVTGSLEELDSTRVSYETASVMLAKASAMRAQIAHAQLSLTTLTAAAAAYESMAHLLNHSAMALQADQRPSATTKKSTRRHKT